MQLLASPIIWLILAVMFLFRNKGEKGTDLSVFDTPIIDNNTGQTTQTTTNGSIIKGATINIAKAKVKANELLELFDAFFSSDQDIVAVFKGLNEKDFMLIYDQFGTTHSRSLFGNEAIGSNGIDLIEWLSKEVTSSSEKKQLQKQFPTIF